MVDDDSTVDAYSHFSHLYSNDDFLSYDNSSIMGYSDIDTSDSPERAREKLMKVNPNLVRFIERVIKMRTHKFEHYKVSKGPLHFLMFCNRMDGK